VRPENIGGQFSGRTGPAHYVSLAIAPFDLPKTDIILLFIGDPDSLDRYS
jgi:hypothetical protein